MEHFTTIEVGPCEVCGADTPHRRTRRVVRPLLAVVALAATAAVLVGMVGGEGLVVAVGALLALAAAILALRQRRPACERCRGRLWMQRREARREQGVGVLLQRARVRLRVRHAPATLREASRAPVEARVSAEPVGRR